MSLKIIIQEEQKSPYPYTHPKTIKYVAKVSNTSSLKIDPYIFDMNPHKEVMDKIKIDLERFLLKDIFEDIVEDINNIPKLIMELEIFLYRNKTDENTKNMIVGVIKVLHNIHSFVKI